MNTQQETQANFVDMVVENLLNQNITLSKELAIVKAELQITQMQLEGLKRLQQTENEE